LITGMSGDILNVDVLTRVFIRNEYLNSKEGRAEAARIEAVNSGPVRG
jgi:hypothetical protein